MSVIVFYHKSIAYNTDTVYKKTFNEVGPPAGGAIPWIIEHKEYLDHLGYDYFLYNSKLNTDLDIDKVKEFKIHN